MANPRTATGIGTALNECNDKPMRPMNDIERMEAENEKLRAIIAEQEAELLRIYRRFYNTTEYGR